MNKISVNFLILFTVSVVYFSCAKAPNEETTSAQAPNEETSSASSSSGGVEMPTQITMEVPNSLKNENELKLKAPRPFKAGSVEVQSHAAEILKMYVSWGLGVTKFIDLIISNVYQSRDYLATHMGEEIPAGDGKLIFNTNSEGVYYLYLIKMNNNLTNIYIDWQKVNGAFKGKVKFIPDTNSDTKEAIVIYDYTLSEPYLDLYILFNTNNSDGISKFRVNLRKITEGEVIARSKVDINPASITNSNSFISSWNLTGYASKTGNGGVYARTTGFNQGVICTNFTISGTNFITNQSTNYTIIGAGVYYITNSFIFSNYTYEEYFNSNGILLWNLAKGDADYHINNHIFSTNYIDILMISNQFIYATNIILVTNSEMETTNVSTVTTNIAACTPDTTNIFQIYYVYESKSYSNIQIVDPNICNTNGQKPALTVNLTNIEQLNSADYTNIALP